MSFKNLLQLLIEFTERAAVIARTIRDDEDLFSLLVQEKTGSQKNERFDQDFKTLADVLIQQTLSHEIDKNFSSLSGRVYGEECSIFSNSLGESVTVSVQENQQTTSQLLCKVLDGNLKAANVLAHQVHRNDIKVNVELKPDLKDISLDDLALWIDPIDSTAEYIRGTHFPFYEEVKTEAGKSVKDSAVVAGLCCVTVLVGVFNRSTGLPVAGVVNQPFASLPSSSQDQGSNQMPVSASKYSGHVYYGVVDGTNNLPNSGDCDVALKSVSVSSSESTDVFDKLRAAGVEPLMAAGAGFKALTVATGHVQAYLCTKDSTYMWDMCGPHALLLSMGGGVVPASSLHLFAGDSVLDHTDHQLQYTTGSSSQAAVNISVYCNTGGVVAYRHPSHLRALARILQ